jgi:cytochrome P450
MDPPEHGAYRALVEAAFTPAAMAAFAPRGRALADEFVAAFAARGGGDAVSELGTPFAVAAQVAFLRLPDAARAQVVEWQDANVRATRATDRTATAAVAAAFADLVAGWVATRRDPAAWPDDDPISGLLAARVDGRPLAEADLVSIVRNWTVGEVGSIAASVGLVAHALAADPGVRARLRAEPEERGPWIDDVLRARGPLVANRRVVTRPTTLAGQRLEAGDRVRLLWPSIDRDERVFDDPDAVRSDRDPAANLLYGAGIHACPGAPLARLELRAVCDALLTHAPDLRLNPADPPRFARPPQGGFERLAVRVG